MVRDVYSCSSVIHSTGTTPEHQQRASTHQPHPSTSVSRLTTPSHSAHNSPRHAAGASNAPAAREFSALYIKWCHFQPVVFRLVFGDIWHAQRIAIEVHQHRLLMCNQQQAQLTHRYLIYRFVCHLFLEYFFIFIFFILICLACCSQYLIVQNPSTSFTALRTNVPSSVVASPERAVVRAGARHHPYRRLQPPSLSIATDDKLVRPSRLDYLLSLPLPDQQTMVGHFAFYC